jgi:hypothetical protein
MCTRCHIGYYDYETIHTPEIHAKNPILQKGYIKSPEHRENIAKAIRGTKASEGTKRKMSEAQKRRWGYRK